MNPTGYTGNTATFNSTPENFYKERSGVKRNTVRKINLKDDRFRLPVYSIRIKCRELKEKPFLRHIKDITDFDGYRIFSW